MSCGQIKLVVIYFWLTAACGGVALEINITLLVLPLVIAFIPSCFVWSILSTLFSNAYH